jgi:hypothetical protein
VSLTSRSLPKAMLPHVTRSTGSAHPYAFCILHNAAKSTVHKTQGLHPVLRYQSCAMPTYQRCAVPHAVRGAGPDLTALCTSLTAYILYRYISKTNHAAEAVLCMQKLCAHGMSVQL